MSRRRPATAAALAAAPAAATIPSTTPLPSDQISAPAENLADRVAAAEAGERRAVDAAGRLAYPVVETAPLPVPERAPRDPSDVVTGGPPLVHVDSTIPLPSDQLTPMVATDRSTDTSATTDAAIAAELGADVLGERRSADWEQLRADELPANTARDRDRVHWLDAGDRAGEALFGDFERRMQDRLSLRDEPPSPEALLRGLELLDRDLQAAGFGVVVLSAETVALFRNFLGLAPLDGQPAALAAADRPAEERRFFAVQFDVQHDGRTVQPGGRVHVTRAEFDRLRAGTAIATATDWLDGERD